MQDFFKDVKFNNLKAADLNDVINNKEKSESQFKLTQANIIAHIPARFSKSIFGQYEVPFLNECKTFAVTPNNDKVFVIAGPAGTGKSTLLCSAIHERAMNDMSENLYMTDRLLSQLIRTSRSFSAKESEYALYERLGKIPFLCIDEVGTGEDEAMERNFIRTVLAIRYDNVLPTMIATNLNFQQFKIFISGGKDQSNDPIMDRLNSIIIPKVLNGESHR